MIENIVISENEEINDIDISKLPSDFVFGAVNVNHDELAYGKTRFDSGSVGWFKENLHLITHTLTRASIWRHFWTLVLDKKMKSVDYMDFLLNQLQHETVEHIITPGIFNLSTLISSFLPIEVCEEKERALFETFVTLLQKEGMVTDPIVDQLFNFLS